MTDEGLANKYGSGVKNVTQHYYKKKKKPCKKKCKKCPVCKASKD